MDVHGSVVLCVVWECDHFCPYYTYSNARPGFICILSHVRTVVFKVLNVVYNNISMHH